MVEACSRMEGVSVGVRIRRKNCTESPAATLEAMVNC
jgi:hypothetical protein